MTSMLTAQNARKQASWAALMPSHAIGGELCPGRDVDGEDLVDRLAADPGLDAEPAAGDQGPQERRDVRPEDAERRPAVDRERDAVLGPGVGVQDHRDQHDRVAQEDRQDRLPPVHPLGDQRRGQHVGRDAGRHRDPEGRDVLGAPPPLRREVGARSGLPWIDPPGGAGSGGSDRVAMFTWRRLSPPSQHPPGPGSLNRSDLECLGRIYRLTRLDG